MRQLYQCEVCGNFYETEKEAMACEERHNKITYRSDLEVGGKQVSLTFKDSHKNTITKDTSPFLLTIGDEKLEFGVDELNSLLRALSKLKSKYNDVVDGVEEDIYKRFINAIFEGMM